MRLRLAFLPRAASTALACAALAACMPPPEPAPAPAPAPALVPAPMPTPVPPPFAGNWMDAPLTPGDWTYRVGPGDTTVALFGESPDRPTFSIGCYQAGQIITFSRYETALAPAPVRILTETHEGSLVTRIADPGGFRTAELPASDPLLDAMAFSKGRFAVEAAGAPTLYIPSYPEVTRVIEDCR
jgi:hypothetical protein